MGRRIAQGVGTGFAYRMAELAAKPKKLVTVVSRSLRACQKGPSDRHPGEGRGPAKARQNWIPASAGMAWELSYNLFGHALRSGPGIGQIKGSAFIMSDYFLLS
jgi:hypothetical protein